MAPEIRSAEASPVAPGRMPGMERTRRPPEAFRDVLKRTLTKAGEVKFSGHALGRLTGREIYLGGSEVARLENAVARAAAKGAKTSLVLLDRLAFVVSVENRTVITVADEEHLKEHVFTNIDSAVVV